MSHAGMTPEATAEYAVFAAEYAAPHLPPKLHVVSSDMEETKTFTLVIGGQKFEITQVNHDDHGWHGMESVTNALIKLAQHLGAHVERDSV